MGAGMKLSTRTRYGVRLMLNLANRYGEGPIYLREIADQEQISEKYLSQIIIPLRGGGLVHSTRGAHGGYALSKNPEEVTLKDIFDILEGETCLVECVKNPKSCERIASCPTWVIWTNLAEKINETLKGITLASLAKMSRNRSKNVIMNNI